MRAFFLIIFVLFPQLLLADDLAELQSANFLLKSELQLAKSAKLYMVIDLPGKAILFKAGGVVLNRLPIDDSHVAGTMQISVLRTLSGKKAEKQPKRKEVKIATEAEVLSAPLPAPGVDTLVALEIGDMPDSYQLLMDDGLTLIVKAPPSGDFMTKAAGYWRDGVETVNEWGLAIMRKIRGESVPPKIVLNLAGADARQFYWSFDEGMACLIND